MARSYNISFVADNEPTVYVRWGMGPSDSTVTYCGWNIDDITFTGEAYCPGDVDGDGDTDQSDLGIMLADWGCYDPVNGCEGDLSGDDQVNQVDLGILLADWGCVLE